MSDTLVNDNEAYTSAARNRAVGALDMDPDEAAQALKLSKYTGVPSTAIAGDLDGFVADQKAKATSDLVRGNPLIADYINSHPLAAQVSNGDLGNLDELSASLKGFQSKTFLQKFHEAISPSGLIEAISPRKLGAAAYPNDALDELIKPKREVGPVEQEFAAAHPYLYKEAKDLTDIWETGIHAFMAPLRGGLNLTHHYLGREAGALLEYEMTRGDIRATGTPHELLDAFTVAQPWLRKGIDPPVGIHPAIDKMKVDQAKVDIKNLDDNVAAAQKTETLERSPESIGAFVKLHGDREIGISSDAIRKLYGDKPPTPDDNLLGWIPDLKGRLETAEVYGGDVWVPKSDYVSKIDPDIHDQLHDFLRTRDGGLSLDEAKAASEVEPKEVISEPLQHVRGSAGLEPMFQVGDRKLTLEKKPQRKEPIGWESVGGATSVDQFRILDETGKKVGYIDANPSADGTQLHIVNMGGFEHLGYGPNSFGPALTRSMIRQLKEVYPNLKEIGGFRVSGARGKARTTGPATIKVQDMLDPLTHEHFRNLLSQNWEELHSGVSALFSKEGVGEASNSIMGQLVLREIARLAPEAQRAVAHDVTTPVGTVRGAYFPNLRAILVSLRNRDPIGTAHHEITHFLKDSGLFRPEEWSELERMATTDWMDRFNVAERWAKFDTNLPEEAIADAFAAWKNGAKFDKVHADLFQRIKDFFEGLRRSVAGLFGHEHLTWEQIFEKIDSGEIGQREGGEGGEGGISAQASPSQPKPGKLVRREEPGGVKIYDTHGWKLINYGSLTMGEGRWKLLDRVNNTERFVDESLAKQMMRDWNEAKREEAKFQAEDEGMTQARIEGGHEPFKAQPDELFDRGKALGVTQVHLDRMNRMLEQRNQNDLTAAQRRAEAKLAKITNREWKERRTAIRDDVREALQQRPDIAATQFFITSKFKIHPDFLTDEQKAQLPKDFIQKKDGVNPDDIAGHFGYPSGDALIRRLAMLSEDRVRSGMSPRDYFNRLVDVETDRRLNAEFQGRDASDLDTAMEQALSETQMNLTHEETLRYATAAGVEPTLDLAKVKAIAKNMADQMSTKELNPQRLMQAALSAGKKVEVAHGKGDIAEAYRMMQARQYAMLVAKIAIDAKRQRANFDRLARTYAKVPTKEVAQRVDQAYYNYIQETLPRVGVGIRRTKVNLESAIEKEGYASIVDFVNQKSQALRDLYIPDFLKDPKWTKPIDQMTHAEFTQLANFIKRMDFNARDERSIIRDGERYDLSQIIDDMIDSLPKSLDAKPLRLDRPEALGKESAKSFWWSFVTVRSMAKRLDRGDPQGLFTRLIANRATSADANKSALLKEFSNKLKAVAGEIPNMAKQVENVLFKDPNTGQALLLSKRNVYGIMGHWGNPSSRTKLLKGWEVEEAPTEDWLRRNTTPEDWDRQQAIGDVLEEVFAKADRMAHEVSGVGIEGLRLEPFIDPHGIGRKGWYNPAKYEDMLPGKSKVALGSNSLEAEGFFRSTTPQGYAKARTGYVAPLELSLDAIPMRMAQMIHDIAWRPAILDMSKLVYNQKLQRAVISRYGKHQMEEFKTFVKNMANGANTDSMAEWYRDGAFEYFRRNTIATLIGLNPSTVAKHGLTAAMNSLTQVGPINFAREFLGMFRGTNTQATTQLRMAYDKSEVIQDRMQNITKLIRGNDPKFSFEPGKFSTVRDIMMHVGSFPVAIGDFASAVPTWLAEYKKQIAQGTLEGPAIEAADRAVIEAHGSAMSSNQPSIMRSGGALARYFTSLYGFFSHMLQKQYEFAWKAKDLWNGEKPLDIEAHWAPHMMGNLWSYWIAPAVIEEMITPYTNNEHESWGAKAAGALINGTSSSMAYVRDFARALFGPYGQPEAGLLGTTYKSGTDLARDLMKHQPLSQENTGKIIKDSVTLTGMLTGLTNAQEGKTAEYIYRYTRGLERPKGPWDAGVGLRYGKTGKHSRTFAEWWKHLWGH